MKNTFLPILLFIWTVGYSASGATPRAALEVDTIADMQAISTNLLNIYKGIRVLGSTNAGDGYGGVFTYDASNTNTSDGTDIVTPNGGLGRFLRVDKERSVSAPTENPNLALLDSSEVNIPRIVFSVNDVAGSDYVNDARSKTLVVLDQTNTVTFVHSEWAWNWYTNYNETNENLIRSTVDTNKISVKIRTPQTLKLATLLDVNLDTTKTNGTQFVWVDNDGVKELGQFDATTLSADIFEPIDDGSADTATQLQLAIDTAAVLKVPLIIPQGTYRLGTGLELTNGSHVLADRNAKFVRGYTASKFDDNGPLVSMRDSWSQTNGIFYTNVVWRGGLFSGNTAVCTTNSRRAVFSGSTVTVTNLDFNALGFSNGWKLDIQFSDLNDGAYTIATVSSNVITINESFSAETATNTYVFKGFEHTGAHLSLFWVDSAEVSGVRADTYTSDYAFFLSGRNVRTFNNDLRGGHVFGEDGIHSYAATNHWHHGNYIESGDDAFVAGQSLSYGTDNVVFSDSTGHSLAGNLTRAIASYSSTFFDTSTPSVNNVSFINIQGTFSYGIGNVGDEHWSGNCDNIYYENIEASFNGLESASAGYGFWIYYADNVSLKNVNMPWGDDRAIWAIDVDNLTVENWRHGGRHNADSKVVVLDGCDDLRLIDCVFDGLTQTNESILKINGCKRVSIVNSRFDGITEGSSGGILNEGNLAINSFPSVSNTPFRWLLSGSGTDEYYLTFSSHNSLQFTEPPDVLHTNTVMIAGTAGSLAANEWDWADNDSLGYSTIYVRTGSDPDSQAQGDLEMRVTFADARIAQNNFTYGVGLTTSYAFQANAPTDGDGITTIGNNWGSFASAALSFGGLFPASLVSLDQPGGQNFAMHLAEKINGSNELRVENLIAAGNTSADSRVTVRAGDPATDDASGYIGAFPNDHTTTVLRDRMVVGANSDADGIVIYAPQSGQFVRAYVGSGANPFDIDAGDVDLNDRFIIMNELSSPPVATPNQIKIFGEDDGGGKTRAMIQFGSGAAVQFAIEP